MTPWPYPRHIAHRGAGRLAPENTLSAIEEGARRGYRCAEIDVACCADGTVVLMHDDSPARTAGGGERLIADLDLGALAGLDAGAWLDPRFAGTRIPTLAAVLARCQALGMQLVIEMKVGRGQDADRLGAAVARTVSAGWSGQPPLLASFTDRALEAAAAQAPAIPRALLVGRTWPSDWLRRATACAACAIDLDHRIIDPGRIAEVHGAGLALLAWTVNDPARAAELLAWGVDGVTTDAVDRIVPEGIGGRVG